MGVVYKGRDSVLERTVAIKTIRTGADFDDQDQYERLLREARSAAGLSHPNIVTVYQAASQEGCVYIAMEFVEGPTLEQWLRSEKASDTDATMRLLRQVAAGLDYAHRKGIVHRDIKPLNILIDDAENAHITDFGLAKGASSAQLTQTGMQVGTPQYVSPEQAQGRKLDGRSDQFALAVIAYRAVSGHAPFEAEEVTTLLFKIVFEECPSALQWNAQLPQQVDAVLKRALAKVPEERYESCTAFIQELETALHAAPALPLPAAGRTGAASRKIAIGVGAAVGCLALMAGIGALFTRHGSPTAPPAPAAATQSKASSIVPAAPSTEPPAVQPDPPPAPVKAAPRETKPAPPTDRPAAKRAAPVTPTPTPAKPLVRGMADWEKPDEWFSEAGWLVHKGGNFVLFGPTGQAGTFSFSAVVMKGKRLQWLVNYQDPRNHELFQIEKRQFLAKDVVNGSARDRSKVATESNPAFLQLSIAVTPHQVTTNIHEGQGWRLVDTWTAQDRDFTQGKFGFLIPGSDQIGLANFQFLPDGKPDLKK
jgi:serine/threonine protein kinase